MGIGPAFVTASHHILLWSLPFYVGTVFRSISIALLFQQSPHGAHLSLQLGDSGVCSFPLLPFLYRREHARSTGARTSLANIRIAFIGQAAYFLRPTVCACAMGGDFHLAEYCLIACGQAGVNSCERGKQKVKRCLTSRGLQEYLLRHLVSHGGSYVLGVLPSAAYRSSNPLPIGNGGFLRVKSNQTFKDHTSRTNLSFPILSLLMQYTKFQVRAAKNEIKPYLVLSFRMVTPTDTPRLLECPPQSVLRRHESRQAYRPYSDRAVTAWSSREIAACHVCHSPTPQCLAERS